MKYIFKNIFRLCIIVLFPVLSYAQSSAEIGDTIRVVTLEEFRIPNNKHIVLTNIKNISFEAELLDVGLKPIRSCTKSWQDPPAKEFPIRGERGTLVQFSLREAIETAGEYFVKVKINFSDERKNNNLDVLYKIIVDYPTIGSEINLRDKYYFSEEETFSFTTMEFKEANAYQYKIMDIAGSIIDSGYGSVVNLNEVMQNENNVGKKIFIHGFYKGREFSFYDAAKGKVSKSVWEFELVKPELDEFVTWKNKDDKGFQAISIYNEKAMNLLYLYVGKTPTGFAVLAPKIRNLIVTSEPKNFIKNFSSSTSGKFLFVKLSVNEDFINSMNECDEADINISLQFTTQFNEKITREYSATVIK
jgi:hypothetical protein